MSEFASGPDKPDIKERLDKLKKEKAREQQLDNKYIELLEQDREVQSASMAVLSKRMSEIEKRAGFTKASPKSLSHRSKTYVITNPIPLDESDGIKTSVTFKRELWRKNNLFAKPEAASLEAQIIYTDNSGNTANGSGVFIELGNTHIYNEVGEPVKTFDPTSDSDLLGMFISSAETTLGLLDPKAH